MLSMPSGTEVPKKQNMYQFLNVSSPLPLPISTLKKVSCTNLKRRQDFEKSLSVSLHAARITNFLLKPGDLGWSVGRGTPTGGLFTFGDSLKVITQEKALHVFSPQHSWDIFGISPPQISFLLNVSVPISLPKCRQN